MPAGTGMCGYSFFLVWFSHVYYNSARIYFFVLNFPSDSSLSVDGFAASIDHKSYWLMWMRSESCVRRRVTYFTANENIITDNPQKATDRRLGCSRLVGIQVYVKQIDKH